MQAFKRQSTNTLSTITLHQVIRGIVAFLAKTHCQWLLRWIYTVIDPNQMTCDEHYMRERTDHLAHNISNTNYDVFFSVIWTGWRKSLTIVSINYDYLKDINLVTKMGQITIKLAIRTAVCNICVLKRPVTSASNSDLQLTL